MAVILGAGVFFLKNGNQNRSMRVGRAQNNSASKTSPESGQTVQPYTLAQVQEHASQSDCWLIIGDSVYDVTSYGPEHPGGEDIYKGCGKDATKMFNGEREHQEMAKTLLETFKIGTLLES